MKETLTDGTFDSCFSQISESSFDPQRSEGSVFQVQIPSCQGISGQRRTGNIEEDLLSKQIKWLLRGLGSREGKSGTREDTRMSVRRATNVFVGELLCFGQQQSASLSVIHVPLPGQFQPAFLELPVSLKYLVPN